MTTHDIEDEPILGGTWLVSGVIVVTWYHDRHYGADADGNRGVERTGEDERQWTILSASPAVGDDWGPGLTGAAIPEDVLEAAEAWAMGSALEDSGEIAREVKKGNQ